MTMAHPDIVGIGGANVDISGRIIGESIAGDSNPGTIRISAGGVCRNICENSIRMGCSAALISAFGEDGNGAFLREHCKRIGLDISASLRDPAGRTGAYLSIHSSDGEMLQAVNDMEIIHRLTPAFLETKTGQIRAASAILVDANLPEETLLWIAEVFRDRPIFADPVSCAKGEGLLSILPGLFLLKPNRMEAAALTGLDRPEESAAALHAKGVRHVFVSCGAEGVIYCGEWGTARARPRPLRQLENATGAGDSLMAGLMTGFLKGMPLEEILSFGVTASVLTLQSPLTIRTDLTSAMIRRFQKECMES